MQRILITGGTDGMGKAIAIHFLKKGDYVIIVGSSQQKGKLFLEEARKLGADERAVFIKADLSSIRENERVVNEIKSRYSSLDKIVLAAASQKYRESITITDEGFEFVFSLMYLSRYIISYSLKDLLQKSKSPVIVNIAAPGMKGVVNWDDIQFKNNYDSNKVKFHTSRLNDLLGVQFSTKETTGKIKYVLFNPWAVRTAGALDVYDSPIKSFFTKFVYKIIGKEVQEAIIPLISLLDNPPNSKLTAYKQEKEVNLSMETFNKENAKKLDKLTMKLLQHND